MTFIGLSWALLLTFIHLSFFMNFNHTSKTKTCTIFTVITQQRWLTENTHSDAGILSCHLCPHFSVNVKQKYILGKKIKKACGCWGLKTQLNLILWCHLVVVKIKNSSHSGVWGPSTRSLMCCYVGPSVHWDL